MKKMFAANGRQSGGFTLIELLLVLVILGILAGIVLPNYRNKTTMARIAATKAQISTFKTALGSFEIENGHFPVGPNGLNQLVVRPPNASSWNGPYVEAIPLDPWHRPYLYACPGKHTPTAFDIISMGPDETLGTPDDIVSWYQTEADAK